MLKTMPLSRIAAEVDQRRSDDHEADRRAPTRYSNSSGTIDVSAATPAAIDTATVST